MTLDPSTFPEARSGFVETMNEQQKEELSKFKEILARDYPEEQKTIEKYPLKYSDSFLLRFLRATMKKKKTDRVFQANKAVERLIDTVAWRTKFKLDELLLDSLKPERYEEYVRIRPRMEWEGETGHLVKIEPLASMMTNVDTKHFTMEQWEGFFAYDSEMVMEKCRLASEKHGREISSIVQLIDESGVGMGFMSRLDVVKTMGNVAGAHYPEMLFKVLVVNTPWIFHTIFGAVKLFLDKDTLSKVEVYKGIPLEYLKSSIDITKLPKEWGGESEEVIPIPFFSLPKKQQVW